MPIFGLLFFLKPEGEKYLKKLDFSTLLEHHCIMNGENNSTGSNESKTPRRSRNAIYYTLAVIVILILILILFLYMIRSPLIFRSGAYSVSQPVGLPSVSTSLSLDNSYIFASPLRAKTGGESIRITVYILDNRGIGIAGKTVSIGGGSLLTVTPIQPTTDSQGRATFDVYSGSSPGVYLIQASTGGVTLTQKATISFD
jgi:hypothetical protein